MNVKLSLSTTVRPTIAIAISAATTNDDDDNNNNNIMILKQQ